MNQTICPCGQPIAPDLVKYGKRYCSSRCRERAKVKRRNGRRCAPDAQIIVHCTECGIAVVRALRELKRYPRPFCSKSCAVRNIRFLQRIRRSQAAMRATPLRALPPGAPAPKPALTRWTPEFIRQYQREWRRERYGTPWIGGQCAECGEHYISKRPGVYCGKPCQRKAIRRRNKQVRRARIRAVPTEPISLADVAARDGWRCHICNQKVSRESWSLDHLVPLAHGGHHTYTNVALAHHRCNALRGTAGFAQLRLVS